MKSFKVRWMQFKIRVVTAYCILTQKYNHWAIFVLSKESNIKLLKGEEFEVDGSYHKMQPYTYFKMIKSIADTKSDTDMVCMKAEFEAAAIHGVKLNPTTTNH